VKGNVMKFIDNAIDNIFGVILLVIWSCSLLLPALFDIGTQMPAYTFTAKTWLAGVAMTFIPAYFGYLIGKGNE
jgi:hypothetical protein